MKFNFKKILLIILVLSLLLVSIIYAFRKHLQLLLIPSVEQSGNIVLKVKNDTCYISSDLIIQNKLFFEVGIDTISYNVTLFNNTYIQKQKPIGIVLSGFSSDTTNFSIAFPYAQFIKDLKEERKIADSSYISINVLLRFNTFFGRSNIPIHKSVKIKIPQPPEIEIVQVKYTKFSPKTIQAIVKIKVMNYSSVNLTMRDMDYKMNLSKMGDINGKYSKKIDIESNGETLVDLPIEISISHLGRTIVEVLTNNDTYKYVLNLNVMLESQNISNQSFQFDLTKNGTIELKK